MEPLSKETRHDSHYLHTALVFKTCGTARLLKLDCHDFTTRDEYGYAR